VVVVGEEEEEEEDMHCYIGVYNPVMCFLCVCRCVFLICMPLYRVHNKVLYKGIYPDVYTLIDTID